MMGNVCFVNRVRRPTQRPYFKTILLEWKWIPFGLRGFIDQFWQNNFVLTSRYGVLNRLRPILEPAITDQMTLRLLAKSQNDKNRNTMYSPVVAMSLLN